MLRVLIADDHTLLSESLCIILGKETDMEVVGTALDGNDAIEKCLQLSPDIVLMDVNMPGVDGIKATKRIKECCPHTKVAILTSFEDGKLVLSSLEAGADGYILKDTPPEKLISIMRNISWGYYTASKTAIKLFLGEILNGSIPDRCKVESDILKREDVEIIRLISQGKSNVEIAGILNFAEGTVRNKIARIISAVGVESRVQLVMFALQNNLL